MTTFAITYDLHQPAQDYDELYDTIESYGDTWHELESVWLVETDTTASTIRDELKEITDSNDEILVMKATTPWASTRVDASWLKEDDHM